MPMNYIIIPALASYAAAITLLALFYRARHRKADREMRAAEKRQTPLHLFRNGTIMRKLDRIERETDQEVARARKTAARALEKARDHKRMYLQSEDRADKLARRVAGLELDRSINRTFGRL
jgi:hypothetical protein